MRGQTNEEPLDPVTNNKLDPDSRMRDGMSADPAESRRAWVSVMHRGAVFD